MRHKRNWRLQVTSFCGKIDFELYCVRSLTASEKKFSFAVVFFADACLRHCDMFIVFQVNYHAALIWNIHRYRWDTNLFQITTVKFDSQIDISAAAAAFSEMTAPN